MWYLQKFNKLPKELREVVSSLSPTKIVEELEKKYNADLAAVVIQVMTKDIAWSDLENYLVQKLQLKLEQAKELKQELEAKIFTKASQYLGINPPTASAVRQAENPENKIAETQSTVSLDEVAKLAGITDEIMKQRLEKIVTIFNKGIRDGIDTQQTLIKAQAAGGLSLTPEKAREVVAFVGKNKVKPLAPVMPKPASPLDSVEQVRDVEYDLGKLKNPSSLVEATKTAEVKPVAKENKPKSTGLKGMFKKILPNKSVPNSTQPKLAPPAPVVQKPAEEPVVNNSPVPAALSKQIEVEAKKVEAKINQPEVKQAVSQVHVNRAPAVSNSTNKPQMNDIVKPLNKLQGPVEELANLDLTNFKRLSNDSSEAAKIVKNKVDLLEEESFTKRQQGINAWRKSPLYQLYIKIGQQSIQTSQSVEEIIKGSGEGNLNLEQFNAIMELNRTLRV